MLDGYKIFYSKGDLYEILFTILFIIFKSYNTRFLRILDNEIQAALLVSDLLSNSKFKRYINIIDSIAHYFIQSMTDLIYLNNKGKTLFVKIEFLLSNLFKHEHAYVT